MQLDGTVAVVTGGANGIGEALARRFAAEGAQVAVADLDGEAARAVAADIGGVAVQVDVADPDANEAMIRTAESELGAVDLLCCNAGIGLGRGVDTPLEEWQRIWEVNVLAHVHAVRAWLPSVLERGEGYLLTTASAAGLLTMLGGLPYSVTKHAAVALAEWLAITHGDAGLKVSCLCPQFVETDLLDELAEMPGGAGLIAQGTRSPDEVADAVVTGLRDETFLILPHPEVREYFQNKATDYDRWIGGMRKLQRHVLGLDGEG